MTTALPSSELALVTAERDEYRGNWRQAERNLTRTVAEDAADKARLLRKLTAAEDAWDDLQARVEAALELLAGEQTELAAQLRAVLDPPRRSA